MILNEFLDINQHLFEVSPSEATVSNLFIKKTRLQKSFKII